MLGVDDGNPLQYTGRENDGTGLYYYRARYYDPALKRFISEDLQRLDGDAGPHAYVENNPVSYVDRDGLQRSLPGGSSVGRGWPGRDLHESLENFPDQRLEYPCLTLSSRYDIRCLWRCPTNRSCPQQYRDVWGATALTPPLWATGPCKRVRCELRCK